MVPDTVEGTVPFVHNEETYYTWYKVVGDLRSKESRPLITIHGGPGLSHDYLLPLADLCTNFKSTQRAVVFYDQLGNARSTHLPDKKSTFWTIDIFIDELVNLLSHLGIVDDFDLLAHSWGGVIAAEFIVRRQPTGLKRLVLSNTLSSARLRDASMARLWKRMPEKTQMLKRRCEEIGSTTSPEYLKAVSDFQRQFFCRIEPMPPALSYSLQQRTKNPSVFNAMRQGEFNKLWDISNKIHLIHVPTLLINGEYDHEADDVCGPFFRGIKDVKWMKFSKSSHVPFWEERDRYMWVVNSFLDEFREWT